ncbi:MAG: hypothetical protein K8R68_07575, partial [Bacteroidales bacterium]|nr:hypothetical protein [Bacteroidales bacterium]
MKKIFLSACFLSIIITTSFAQILDPIKWSYNQEIIEESHAELSFSATIEKNWHLYSQNVPEGGPVKTSFYFYDIEGFEFVDKDVKIEEEESYEQENDIDYIVSFIEPKGHEENDPNFGMVVKYFEHEALFTRKIILTTEKPLSIKGYIYFMCCDDTKCLPPAEVDFEFTFNGAESSLSPEETPEGSPLVEVGQIETKNIESASKETKYKRTFEILKDKSVLEKVSIGNVVNKSLWELFIYSILAGLIAILTPCVFPMIPMTVSFFMKDKKAKGKMEAIIFGISIIGIYTIVGTIIAVTLGVNFANWLSTHWIPNVLFFLIFVIFAA